MKYLDLNLLYNAIQEQEKMASMIHTLKREVNEFCNDFQDDPIKISRWGHHYFCQKDGGLLIYDRKRPNEHQCSVCGQTYQSELLHGVWIYMYRNEAILNAWKSALLYKITGKQKYLQYVKNIIGYYTEHYLEFKLHNKEGLEFESMDDMKWGCGRVMPQSLNESIFIIRMINALELVKEDIGQIFLERVHHNLFREAYKLFRPQVNKIHNISCWLNSAVGLMGLFSNDKEMIEYAFEGEYNIRKQISEGVTEDGFWYEGSIHYNFFTLEGVIHLLLFSELYNFDFGLSKDIVRKMFVAAYHYAFDNHQLPNPNDGWPNVNLKSYSYIYSIAAKIFGIHSEIGNVLKNILNKESVRGEFPLSRPYYYQNDISLERLILIPSLNPEEAKEIRCTSRNFKTSYCGIIKGNNINIFYKYGHNGPSHAHPDKMNIEVIIGKHSLSRDLSNSGYGIRLCNEWHRMSPSHNTVVVNGESHLSMDAGECMEFLPNTLDAKVSDVYPGIQFRRRIEIIEDGFKDCFQVLANKINIYDYFFHVEGNLLSDLQLEKSNLIYKKNGYQHIHHVYEVVVQQPYIELDWKLGDFIMTSTIELDNKKLFISKTPDNPVTHQRATLIIRSNAKEATYNVMWKIKKGG